MKTLYSLLVAALTLSAVTGCSDNVDQSLEPIEMTRTLALKVESEMFSNGKLSVGAASSTTDVLVESNTRWTVEVVDCEGSWCEVSPATGAADGSFSISVRENLSEQRNCYVRVYKSNAKGEKELTGSQEILVTQTMSTIRLSPSSVEPFAAKGAQPQVFTITSNVSWNLAVTYQSAVEFVEITPISGTMEADGNGFKGSGDARFSVSLQDNMTAADRTAFLNLTAETGSYTVEITQRKSDYIFDVSPTEPQVLPAGGGQIDFGILSLSDWTITTVAEWITISPSSGKGGNDVSKVTATVAPNNSLYERSAEIRFNPTQQNYQGHTVTVTQRGFDLTFSVSPAGTLGEVSAAGEVKYITIDSRFDWELMLPEWITADKTSGAASIGEQSVTLTISRSLIRDPRTGTVIIVPKPTEFSGGAILDPTALGIDPLRLSVSQLGADMPTDRPAESDNPTPSN
ncbi:MAG: hypothetical protein K2M19_03390 [Muribaculaceae bacterium]|nr:hypothetical protein [Muribaculaceae bacterium]